MFFSILSPNSGNLFWIYIFALFKIDTKSHNYWLISPVYIVSIDLITVVSNFLIVEDILS